MVVKCKKSGIPHPESEIPLEWIEENIGAEFNVYGIYVENGNTLFCLKTDTFGYTPMLCHSDYFDIIDGTLYPEWEFQFNDYGGFNLIFSKWAKFPDHLIFFSTPWEYEENELEYLFELDSFHKWVMIIDNWQANR